MVDVDRNKISFIFLGILVLVAVGVVLILAPLNFINIIAVGAAFFYLVDVRPAVKQYRAGGAQENMGPYGPW